MQQPCLLCGRNPSDRITSDLCSRACWAASSRSAARITQATGGTASAAEIRSALDLLEARAQFDAAKRAVHVRIAEHAGHIYLDLANEQWRAGWMARPVRFRRPPGMLPLCASIRRAQFVPQSCRLKGPLNRQCCHTIARDRAAKSFAAIGTLGPRCPGS
jgi:hypothetical protein